MVMVQVRNVPEDVHRELKVRAAQAGTSLSEYVLAELVRLTARPTLDQLAERIRNRDLTYPRDDLRVEVTSALHAEREQRAHHLANVTRPR